MASLRKAAACIDVTPPFSVAHDFFGFRTGGPRSVSLLKQMQRLQSKHFHLNFIHTGPASYEDLQDIDSALQKARSLFHRAEIGIGRVQHFTVPKGGYAIITSTDHAEKLWESWSVANDGIDVFLVFAILGAAGKSPTPGSCSKSGKDSGLVVGLSNAGIGVEPAHDLFAVEALYLALAHEIGHYLGLPHSGDQNNLMYPTLSGNRLTPPEGALMKRHCMMHGGCSM